MKPRPHQSEAIKAAKDYYRLNQRGKLIMAFRAGKTLTSAWISKRLSAERIIFLVPTLYLQRQALIDFGKIYTGIPVLCVGSDKEVAKNRDFVGVTTAQKEIENFLSKNARCIVFCTYHSSQVMSAAALNTDYGFDFGIFDEAHRTTGEKENLFPMLLREKNIRIAKRMFMTATEKTYNDKGIMSSMDDERLYGKTFFYLSVAEAIKRKILADYQVVSSLFTSKEIAEKAKKADLIISDEKKYEVQLVTAAVALTKLLKKNRVRKVIVYCNSKIKSRRFIQISRFIFALEKIDIPVAHVDGGMSNSNKNKRLADFKSAKKAIISNVYLIREGVDVPDCDCVVFANPRSSVIDVGQMAGRVMTRSPGKKRGLVVVPGIFTADEQFFESSEFIALLYIARNLSETDSRLLYELRVRGDRSNEKYLKVEGSEQLKADIDLADFYNSIKMRIWKRIGRENFMTFEEARKYVIENLVPLGIDTERGWRANKDKIPVRIPAAPPSVYKNTGWSGWNYWFGGVKDYIRKSGFVTFSEARKRAIEELTKSGIDTSAKYRRAAIDRRIPKDMPPYPSRYYKEEWQGWSHFFGRRRRKNVLTDDYEKAKKWIVENKNKLQLVTYQKFLDLPKSEMPAWMPTNPHQHFPEYEIIDFMGVKEHKNDKLLKFIEETGLPKYKFAEQIGWSDESLRNGLKCRSRVLMKKFNQFYEGKYILTYDLVEYEYVVQKIKNGN